MEQDYTLNKGDLDRVEIGHLFENYIVHLKGETTTLEECSPDRQFEEIIPENNKTPDLVFSFLKGGKKD